MMLRKTLLSAVLLGAFAVPAMAEDVPSHNGPGAGGAPHSEGVPPKMEYKNPADTDGDGFLSRAEFDANNAKRFAEMDKDGDGKISKEEHKAFRDSKREEFKEKRKEWKEKRGEKKTDGAVETHPAE